MLPSWERGLISASPLHFWAATFSLLKLGAGGDDESILNRLRQAYPMGQGEKTQAEGRSEPTPCLFANLSSPTMYVALTLLLLGHPRQFYGSWGDASCRIGSRVLPQGCTEPPLRQPSCAQLGWCKGDSGRGEGVGTGRLMFSGPNGSTWIRAA